MKRTAILCLAFAAGLTAQAPTTSWPVYHGDYSGRRFSPLTGINDKNIGAWRRHGPSAPGSEAG